MEAATGGDEDQNKILEGAKHLNQYEKLTEKMLEEDQIKLLNEEKKTLEKEIKTKEEKLRKLKMAELYRRKDDLSNLDELIIKWKQASQEILVDLQNALPESKPSIPDLLKTFKIEANLIGYNETEECFI